MAAVLILFQVLLITKFISVFQSQYCTISTLQHLWMLKCALDNIFKVTEFTNLNPSSLLIVCKLPVQIAGLETFSLPTLEPESPSCIFTWHLGNDTNYSIIVLSSDGVCTFRTISHQWHLLIFYHYEFSLFTADLTLLCKKMLITKRWSLIPIP